MLTKKKIIHEAIEIWILCTSALLLSCGYVKVSIRPLPWFLIMKVSGLDPPGIQIVHGPMVMTWE